MTNFEILENIGTEAVKKHRVQKRKSGLNFMIIPNDFPTDQTYMECSDGTINLLSFTNGSMDFVIVGELLPAESDAVRKKYNFLPIGNR